MEKRNESCFKFKSPERKIFMKNNKEKYEINRIRQKAFEEHFVDGKLSYKTRRLMEKYDIVDDVSPSAFPWNLMECLCDFKKLIEENGSYAILANKRKLVIFIKKWIYSVFGEIPTDFDPLKTGRNAFSKMAYIMKKYYIDQETLQDVSNRFDLSQERIRQIAMECLRIMRSYKIQSLVETLPTDPTEVYITRLRLTHFLKCNVYGNVLPILFKDKRIPLLNLDMEPEYDPTLPYSAYNGDFNFYCECLINTEFRHMYFGDKYDDILDDKTRIITASASHVPGDDILDEYDFYEESAYVDIEHNAIRIKINHS